MHSLLYSACTSQLLSLKVYVLPLPLFLNQDNILSNLKLILVLVYLDNINMFSITFAKHLGNLNDVFKCISNNNLKLKPKKCSFLKSELDYLGFVIDKKVYILSQPKSKLLR